MVLSDAVVHTASAYGNRLLDSLGVTARCSPARDAAHPALRYAQSGLLALTGRAGDASSICPVPLASCADGALAALAALDGSSALDAIDGGALLGERAALLGLARNGAVSAGGSCRLLEVRDGWLALNLARDDDWELLPAWLEVDAVAGWDAVAAVLKQRLLAGCIERGRMLGLAVAASEHSPGDRSRWYRDTGASRAPRPARAGDAAPLVVDLSSLWAGPLCTHLLQRLGARVVKVESIQRPDGARRGNAAFYALLNAGKASVALDFSTAEGRAQLRALCARADIVVEASRPRALRQLGIDAEQLVKANPALTWISLTGYGRVDPMANWVAFGDDAAVAAGLSRLVADSCGTLDDGAPDYGAPDYSPPNYSAPNNSASNCGSPGRGTPGYGTPRLVTAAFCGDAVADPLTGLHAALLAWHGYRSGGGGLRALALRDVVAHCIAAELAQPRARLQASSIEWRAVIERAGLLDAQPVARRAAGCARELGADNREFS